MESIWHQYVSLVSTFTLWHQYAGGPLVDFTFTKVWIYILIPTPVQWSKSQKQISKLGEIVTGWWTWLVLPSPLPHPAWRHCGRSSQTFGSLWLIWFRIAFSICVERVSSLLVFLPKIAGVDVGEFKRVVEFCIRNKVLRGPCLEGPVSHVEGVAH